jgi:hypothetical protein
MGRIAMHKGIGGKARRKEPLGRPRRRWVENIKIYLKRDGMGLSKNIKIRIYKTVTGLCFCVGVKRGP